MCRIGMRVVWRARMPSSTGALGWVPKDKRGVSMAVPASVNSQAASFTLTFAVEEEETSQAMVWLIYGDGQAEGGVTAVQATLVKGLSIGSYGVTIPIPLGGLQQ